MKTVFVSYAREDLPRVEDLSCRLEKHEITVWRDQTRLYAGQRWPKAIGEAIAGQEAFLLVWSRAAAASHFVEFEWTTAVALQKSIIPCLLDDTPLPSALCATHSLSLAEDFQTVLPDLLQALNRSPTEPGIEHRDQVLAKLDEILSAPPQEVVKQARTLFQQQGWSVAGSVYQAGGDIHIHEGEKSPNKSKLEPWVKIVTLISLLVGIGIGVLTLGDRITEKFFPEIPSTPLRGLVTDRQGSPVADAVIAIDGNPELQAITTSDGGFYLPEIPGQPGDRVRVYVKKTGYRNHNEYVALPGPVRIKLEE